ncbi:MAG TPA: hypothetical protein VN831_07220 [Bradyrhizobium sp.]|nr:hypothetical protein [Bradyrhizobium sp.]
MKHLTIVLWTVAAVLVAADVALAQSVPLGASQFNPPLPPPPPPPKIEVPVIPQMDAPLRQNYAPAPRPSFSDRISRCLDEGAASGLGPNERAAYSRSCANR